MKASLQLNISQSLTMTPQLQQAIKLLQLSTLDLQQEIQEALESNPLLELAEDTPDNNSDSGLSEELPAPGQEASSPEEAPVLEQPDTLPNEDMPVDSAWDDVYQSTPSYSITSGDDESDYNYENNSGSGETLFDHLNWQLELTHLSPRDKAIGMAIIEALDPDGYLSESIEEIVATVNADLADEPEPTDENTFSDWVDADEVTAVLHSIQQLDPPGIAARDLQECLLLQLRALPNDVDLRESAIELIEHHLDSLASHDYAGMEKKLGLDEDTLKEVLQLIQSLDPKPGQKISPSTTEYVVPDVIVTRKNDRWHVELNHDAIPRLRINSNYASLIKRADSSADNQFLKSHLQEARWFLKSLISRNETLLKVATKIVERQQGFLEYGEEAMKPMVLHDIAEDIGMHESTISRVTTQKYMHTPQGIFELKYFFSSHVSTSGGGECSSTAIRAIIKKLIAAENPRKPLSDSKLAKLLEEQGIQVARRTIAKYREGMNIPPSNERKRLV